MNITTVKKLKNFLSKLDDNARILFSDGGDIEDPYTFEIRTIKNYLKDYDEEARDEVFDDAKQNFGAKENSVVIHVEF